MAVSLNKQGFAFAEVVDILAEMFEVHPDRRDTFVSRLQQLQKLGLPGDVNVGRGAKVRYVNWQLADLALMLNLIDCGITPGMLKEYFAPNDRNYIGVYSSGGYGIIVQGSLADGEPQLFFLLRLNALAYLTRPRSADSDNQPSPFDQMKMGRSSNNVVVEFENGPALTINVTAHLRRVRRAVEKTYPERMQDITFFPTRSGMKEET